MAILDDLHARGLIADCTDRESLAQLLAAGVVPLYAGYDPTSSSLHVGNLVPTIMLKRFQLAGHKPIVLVGGATGMVGDPSGKSDERNLLDEATLQTNLAGMRAQLSRLLDFGEGPTGGLMVNNADWTRELTFLGFLRDVGKHLTVNYMMAKDSVKSRLSSDSGISWTEFSYMLLQAYDFVHLADAHGCKLQVGGSDQFGNITAGCELSRKMCQRQLFGLTAPLLLDSSGEKMGKTSTGERIWLDPERTSPYAFYQYWLNVSDADVGRLLRIFSLRPLAELDAVLAEHDADRARRTAQRELARTMTGWVHGEAAIAPIEQAARVMFGGSLDGLKDTDLAPLTGTVPTVEIPRAELATGIKLVDFMIRVGLATSKGKSSELIASGGAYVNNKRIDQKDTAIGLDHLATESMIVVRSGKKSYCLVRVV